jgi:hypothetical protein
MSRDPHIIAACVIAAATNAKELTNIDSKNIAVAALDIYDALEAEAKRRQK